jgi:hypothetical protein
VTAVQKLSVFRELPRNWGAAAAELLRIEESSDWNRGNSSFSQYISDLANEVEKARPTFWRLVNAGHTYNSLRSQLDPRGDTLPPLEHAPQKLSPEALVLLSKIERVAPAAVMPALNRGVMAGEISTGRLRSVWETYKPVLNGKTKRGRGTATPRFNARDKAMQGARFEAQIIADLKAQGPKWLGFTGVPSVYTVIKLGSAGAVSQSDAVVLFAGTNSSSLTIHAIKAATGHFERLQNITSSGIDYRWLATPERLTGKELARVPVEIGLLVGKPGSVSVFRPATQITKGPAEQEFLRILLRHIATRH